MDAYKEFRKREDAREEFIDSMKRVEKSLKRTMEENDGWSQRVMRVITGKENNSITRYDKFKNGGKRKDITL